MSRLVNLVLAGEDRAKWYAFLPRFSQWIDTDGTE